MKKIFRLTAMAVIVLGLTVACKSKAAEEPQDTTPIDTMPLVEEVIDTIEEVAEEVAEPVKPAKQAKKTVKKEEPSTGLNATRTTNQEAKPILQKAPSADASKRGEISKDQVLQKADDKKIVATSKK